MIILIILGRIIREADLAKFAPEFEKVEFFEGETVRSSSGSYWYC